MTLTAFFSQRFSDLELEGSDLALKKMEDMFMNGQHPFPFPHLLVLPFLKSLLPQAPLSSNFLTLFAF
jgi:hypothetical protein